jgi:hypothetical protein
MATAEATDQREPGTMELVNGTASVDVLAPHYQPPVGLVDQEKPAHKENVDKCSFAGVDKPPAMAEPAVQRTPDIKEAANGVADPPPPMEYRIGKGELLGGGLSGLVELLPDGRVAKSPWTGDRAKESEEDLRFEAGVYARLQGRLSASEYADHFIELYSCDPTDSTLIMVSFAVGRSQIDSLFV